VACCWIFSIWSLVLLLLLLLLLFAVVGIPVFPRLGAMAKSKNHTGHNQIYKNHRNGIKKERRPRKMSMRGMNCRFVRNQAFAKRGMKCTEEEKVERLAAQKEAQKRMEEKKVVERAERLKELAAEKTTKGKK